MIIPHGLGHSYQSRAYVNNKIDILLGIVVLLMHHVQQGQSYFKCLFCLKLPTDNAQQHKIFDKDWQHNAYSSHQKELVAPYHLSRGVFHLPRFVFFAKRIVPLIICHLEMIVAYFYAKGLIGRCN